MSTHDPQQKQDLLEGAEEKPPIFRTWRQWYIAILTELVLLVVLFRIITVVFE